MQSNVVRGAVVAAVLLGMVSGRHNSLEAKGQLQSGVPSASQRGTQVPGNHSVADEPSGRHEAEERMARSRNDERQKRLVSDTDKLLALATQLHEDVGKTDKNTLSLDVIRRAQEIEKLAHDVKERMKG